MPVYTIFILLGRVAKNPENLTIIGFKVPFSWWNTTIRKTTPIISTVCGAIWKMISGWMSCGYIIRKVMQLNNEAITKPSINF